MLTKISKLKGSSKPLLILHDPDDQITKFSGSKTYFDQSTTDFKYLIEMKGSKHDLLIGERDRIYKEFAIF